MTGTTTGGAGGREVLCFYDEHPINEARILAALDRAGKDLAALVPEDLFDHDQDHYGGLDAVEALIDHVTVRKGHHVLDVCCGLGGPARYLAHTRDARVTGVDLNGGRVAAAARLSARVALDAVTAFVRGDACRLPFAADSFDAAICQEALLHVPDKATALAEIRRVLRPGGRFAFTDWVAGPQLAAGDRARLATGITALDIAGPGDYENMLTGAGFGDIRREDVSAAWQSILRERLEMFRSMEGDTVAAFGSERFATYIDAYEFFVARIGAGALGGGRFSGRA